ncbi:MAG: flagellar hook-basal body complex protein [Desulfonatronovibrio sp. MSAO_Bac4]|nr:MAG: flagellar hook-basal body complex protein [Desulfonatronovibrio sp. MSAO_Bac4]
MMANLDSNSVDRSTSSPRAEKELGSILVSYNVGGDTVYLDPADDRLKDADGNDYIVEDVEGSGWNYKLEWDDTEEEFILVDGADDGGGAADPGYDDDPASDHDVEVKVDQGFIKYNIDGGDDVYLSPLDNRLKDENRDPIEVNVEGPAGTFNDYELEWDEDNSQFILVNAGEALDGEPASENDVIVEQNSSSFFAMYENWDATQDEPLGDNRYAYQSTIKVYDANGSAYNMTTYFDPVRDEEVIEASGGDRQWEYMVTVDPVNDNRNWGEVTDSDALKKRGVLMTGTLTFNAAGDLVGQSAFTLNDQDALDSAGNLSSWQQAEFSNNGYPVVTPNFLNEANASFSDSDEARNIEINFGLRNRTATWGGGATNANAIAEDPSRLPNFGDSERSALSTTQYSSASTTLFQSQDGYTAGFLQNISIDRDGVMTGRYSNGQVLDLYALTLADFNSTSGLRREGGNLFSETRSSGPAITGLAGTGSLGSISGNSLEMSNVDLATEFVKMITSEKGFQANSKTITTTDQMLNVLIQMKR